MRRMTAKLPIRPAATGKATMSMVALALTVDSAMHVDQETKVAPRRAPKLGEHTEQILKELGFDTAGFSARVRIPNLL
jgi:crotonobetainyl-CoA:carnitine CoA-transferase CaiB-like acyl-CoA transferase